MACFHIPLEITLDDIRSQGATFSARMYHRVVIPTTVTKRVRELLNPKNPFNKGIEPGSIWYLRQSHRYLIRTKALQDHSCIIYPKGAAIVPVNPLAFKDPNLSHGDILMSKDSNIGECAVVDGSEWKNHMFSGGIVRLQPNSDRWYLFSFLKNRLFKDQLHVMTASGATITHAKTLWLDCLIPFPNQEDADRVVKYVSALMEAIVDKQQAIKDRHRRILSMIDNELKKNQRGMTLVYAHPTIRDLRATSRMDTGLYCEGFRKFKHLVDNYKHGSTCLSEMGVKSRRGPNLAVSVIGKSLYSEVPKEGWYQLIRPVNISEYGTLTRREWLGNKRNLPTVDSGDMILGCEGFEKGRSIVLIEGLERCTTNFHGTVLYWPGRELFQVVFLRCFLAYLRERGVIDWVGVGGSGGHMSPEYFDFLPFPKFSETVQADIARLYYSSPEPPRDSPSLDTFVNWHLRQNAGMGIWELDRELGSLQNTLANVQDEIIEGKTVNVRT